MKTYYVTTAIDYVNGNPHIGHAYEKLIADLLARWHRFLGEDVVFSVGTDEHGQKNQEAADKRNISAQEFVDEQSSKFKEMYKSLKLSNDVFVRTTDEKHKTFVQDLVKKVNDNGDIYKGEYEGKYCVGCESYKTEKELEDGNCLIHQKPVQVRKEQTYFFKQSKYQDQIKKWITDGAIFPESRKNEILNRLEEPLQDLAITRLKENLTWGIDFPLDDGHVIYVWFDALPNYLSLLSDEQLNSHWPANAHVIGKDIMWFHAVIWPAILISAGYNLPEKLLVHGFINDAKGHKMSKSIGNVIDPYKILKLYGLDALRFFTYSALVTGEDGNFSEEALIEKYNNQLGNDLGNLVKRLITLTAKMQGGKLDPADDDLKSSECIEEVKKHMNNFAFHQALDTIWTQVRKLNAYMNEKQPWRQEEGRAQVLYCGLENVRILAHYLSPFIPDAADAIAKQLGFELVKLEDLKYGSQKYDLEIQPVLFPRLEKPEEFSLDFRVGKIVEIDELEGSDRLFVEKIDIGDETRQIVSGLREHYSKEDLLGKQVIVVANLKPAKLRGVESAGMVICSEFDGKVVTIDGSDFNVGDQVKPAALEVTDNLVDFKVFDKVKFTVQDSIVYANEHQLEVEGKPMKVAQDDNCKIC